MSQVQLLKSNFPLILLTLDNLVLRGEIQADTVHTMSLIRRRLEALTFEYVTQVTTTVCAHNLGACHAECAILMASYGAGDAVEIGWPATARTELVVRLVKGSIAAGAGVDTLGRGMLVVLTRARGLSSLFSKNTELLCTMLVGCHVQETKTDQLTLVQDCSPLIVGTLVGIRHLGSFRYRGAEESTQEGHGTKMSCLDCR